MFSELGLANEESGDGMQTKQDLGSKGALSGGGDGAVSRRAVLKGGVAGAAGGFLCERVGAFSPGGGGPGRAEALMPSWL